MKKELQPHIKCGKGDVARYVLMPGDPERVLRIRGLLDKYEEIAFNREYRTITGTYNGVRVSACSTGIGGPSTCIAIHELANIGAEVFIRVGSCGVLVEKLRMGDIVIPSKSLCDDGTSKIYAKSKFVTPDKVVFNALMSAAKRLEIRYYTGINRSHDSFYRSDQMEIEEKFHKEGFTSEDMETSTLFTGRKRLDLKTGSVLNVVATFGQKPEEGIKEYATGKEAAMAGEKKEIKVALEAVALLEEKRA